MLINWSIGLFLVSSCCIIHESCASAGDADPLYRSCVNQCTSNGCIEKEEGNHLVLNLLNIMENGLSNVFWDFRDIDLTEKLDYFYAVAVVGYSLIVSVMRSLHVRDEAARVMVAATLLAFIATHILFLNNYDMDYDF